VRYFIAAVVTTLTVAAPAASVVVPVPALDHVVVVVFENKETSSVLGNRSAPTFNAYARRYARLTRYYGVTHPSLPNYLALVSGSTHGISSDCTTCTVSASNLADTLEAAGKTLCEEARPLRVLRGHRRESEQAGEDRPAGTARH
jgi:acid phosphatase